MYFKLKSIKNWKITKKLIVSSSFVFVMILAVLFIVFLSYQNIEKDIEKVVKSNVKLLLNNSKISLNISKIFSNLDLMGNSNIKDSEKWEKEKQKALILVTDLKDENSQTDIQKTINSLKIPLDIYFDQGFMLTIYANKISTGNDNLILFINELDYIIDSVIRNYALDGKDSTQLRKIKRNIPKYRANILRSQILLSSIQDNKLKIQKIRKENHIKKIVELIDSVFISMRMINKNDIEIKNQVDLIIKNIVLQRKEILFFQQESSKFKTYFENLLAIQKNLTILMSVINKDVTQTAHNIQKKTSIEINSSRITILILSAIVFVILVLEGFIINWMIKPIITLTATAQEISDGKLDQEINIKTKDEIGSLALSFSIMRDSIKNKIDELDLRVIERTKELEETQNKLLEQSRQAGMAEVATNVIHNVGNVLNSINTTTYMNTKSLNELQLPVIAKVVRLLEENKDTIPEFITTDKIGKMIPNIISEFYEYLKEQKSELLQNSEDIKENIEHIQNIINMQQSYATNVLINELESPQEIMTTAIRMNANSFDRHNIKLIKNFEKISDIKTDKHKILQILINLITNAKGAFKEQPEEGREIICSIRKVEEFIEFEIKDNAIGISKENLNKIFTHGFTTKDDGHGFGLHNSANNAKQLGGDINLISDGLGKGAIFILKIPAIYNDKTNKEVT